MKMKTVLITGGAGGIGSAAARLFSQNGYQVLLQYHTARWQAEKIKAELPGCEIFGADLTSAAAVNEMTAQIKKSFPHIGILVNNCGIAQQKLFTDITENDWDTMMDTNVKSAFLVTKAVLPDMIREQHGCIINIASMWGQVGASCEVHYSASKAALIGMTKALAKELGPSGIRVNCICPGVINTKMNTLLTAETLSQLTEETPLGRIGTPEDVANCMRFLASDESAFITGQVLGVSGGMII